MECVEPKGFPHFTKKHKSFMADTLTNGMYWRNAEKQTQKGFSLDDAINCGVELPHLGVGAVLSDLEC